MNKISKRDVKFFLLGIFALFFIESLWNWKEHASSFQRGFNEGYNSWKE